MRMETFKMLLRWSTPQFQRRARTDRECTAGAALPPTHISAAHHTGGIRRAERENGHAEIGNLNAGTDQEQALDGYISTGGGRVTAKSLLVWSAPQRARRRKDERTVRSISQHATSGLRLWQPCIRLNSQKKPVAVEEFLYRSPRPPSNIRA